MCRIESARANESRVCFGKSLRVSIFERVSRELSDTLTESFGLCDAEGIESLIPGALSLKKFSEWKLNGRNSAAERASDADENNDAVRSRIISAVMPMTIRETARARRMEISPANIDVMVGITTGIEKNSQSNMDKYSTRTHYHSRGLL